MRACFQAERRSFLSRTGLRRLRKEGWLPGIVFGTNTDNVMIRLPMREFQRWVRLGGSGIIDLKLEGVGTMPVLLEAVQRDPVTRDFLHVDFFRIQKDEIVRTKIAIHYTGTPKGSKAGGILQTQSTFVEVEALPDQLPASIAVDISDMDIGDTLLVEHIELPAGVSLVSSTQELLISVVAAKASSS